MVYGFCVHSLAALELTMVGLAVVNALESELARGIDITELDTAGTIAVLTLGDGVLMPLGYISGQVGTVGNNVVGEIAVVGLTAVGSTDIG